MHHKTKPWNTIQQVQCDVLSCLMPRSGGVVLSHLTLSTVQFVRRGDESHHVRCCVAVSFHLMLCTMHTTALMHHIRIVRDVVSRFCPVQCDAM